jgi:hypothetical protein
MDADFHELIELARDLGTVPANAGPLIVAAVQVTATKVKKSAQAKVKRRLQVVVGPAEHHRLRGQGYGHSS